MATTSLRLVEHAKEEPTRLPYGMRTPHGFLRIDLCMPKHEAADIAKALYYVLDGKPLMQKTHDDLLGLANLFAHAMPYTDPEDLRELQYHMHPECPFCR